MLAVLGLSVLTGNPCKLRVIWESTNKSDFWDAEMLARIARFDPELLYPIHDLLAEVLLPIIEQIKSLTKKINQYDWQIEQVSKERYPETESLRQVCGVGPFGPDCDLIKAIWATTFGAWWKNC